MQSPGVDLPNCKTMLVNDACFTITFPGAVSRGFRCKVCLGLTIGFLECTNTAEMGSSDCAAQHASASGWIYLQNWALRVLNAVPWCAVPFLFLGRPPEARFAARVHPNWLI